MTPIINIIPLQAHPQLGAKEAVLLGTDTRYIIETGEITAIILNVLVRYEINPRLNSIFQLIADRKTQVDMRNGAYLVKQVSQVQNGFETVYRLKNDLDVIIDEQFAIDEVEYVFNMIYNSQIKLIDDGIMQFIIQRADQDGRLQ